MVVIKWLPRRRSLMTNEHMQMRLDIKYYIQNNNKSCSQKSAVHFGPISHPNAPMKLGIFIIWKEFCKRNRKAISDKHFF